MEGRQCTGDATVDGQAEGLRMRGRREGTEPEAAGGPDGGGSL